MNFDEQVVLITGASSGIGRSVAQAFSNAGASVAVHYNNGKIAAQDTLQSLDSANHSMFQADITQPSEASALVTDVISEMGAIDVLVNNAGIFENHAVPGTSYEEWQQSWQRTLGVNLIGAANITFCVVEHMMKRRSGKIVNISSRGAFRGEPEAPAYGASKAGLNAFSQSMAQSLAPHNIFVYVVAPGFVQTDMVTELLSGPDGESIRKQSPLGRVAIPEEIARTVLFLASEGTDYLTGCIVDVNGASYLRT